MSPRDHCESSRPLKNGNDCKSYRGPIKFQISSPNFTAIKPVITIKVRPIDHYRLFEIGDQLDMSGSKQQTFHLKEVGFRNCHQNESLEMQTKKCYFFSNPHFHMGPGVDRFAYHR